MAKVVVDSHLRSLFKGLSWRFTASLTTVIIAWIVIGDVNVALAIGGVEVFAKIFIYYVHERIWVNVPFGRKIVDEEPEQEQTEAAAETCAAG